MTAKTPHEVLARVVADAERTAEQVSPPSTRWKIRAVVLEAYEYDEERDEEVPTGKTVVHGPRDVVFG